MDPTPTHKRQIHYHKKWPGHNGKYYSLHTKQELIHKYHSLHTKQEPKHNAYHCMPNRSQAGPIHHSTPRRCKYITSLPLQVPQTEHRPKKRKEKKNQRIKHNNTQDRRCLRKRAKARVPLAAYSPLRPLSPPVFPTIMVGKNSGYIYRL